MISRAVALCGTEQVDPPLRRLEAGTMTADFDNGAVRYIRIGGIEVLRGISFLLRDENWGTLAAELSDLRIEEREDTFTVTYRARCADARRELVYDARIEGRADGSLSFEAVAEPKTDVLTNRTGFIVLHPVDGVAGRPARILHVDGREERATFPEVIDPRCPFRDVRALSHEVVPGTWAVCTMEGDAYETEDQRNWSDASYKTYIRPLSKPWPYTLSKGEKIVQSVRLHIEGPLPAAAGGGSDGPVSIRIGDAVGRLPAIGLGVPPEETAHALANPDLMKKLAPKSLICQIDLRKGHGRAEMERYRDLAALTGAAVTLEIITLGTMDPGGELAPVAKAAAEAGLEPAAVTAFPQQELVSYQPDQPWPEMPTFEQTYAAARAAFPNARIGGGMAVYFTELNRKRPPAGPLDFVTHTTCPNVHAADDVSVMETNESLPYIILSTRAFMGEGMEYRIGPSALGCRENPYGKSTTPNSDNRRTCLSVLDPRQRGLFNAAWTLAYVAACARGGVAAVAMGAPSGPFGHFYRRADFEQPGFDEQEGTPVFPSFHVMAGLAAASGADLLDVQPSRKGAVEVLAVRKGAGTELWIANRTAAPVELDLAGSGMEKARVAVLDAAALEKAATDPDHLDRGQALPAGGRLRLDAYAVVRAVSE